MNEQPYTIGVIVTMLLAALGAFMKGTVMLTSTHRDQVADLERRLVDANSRTEVERLRSDRWVEFGMRATGVTEDLLAITKQRDGRDTRDSNDRERPR